MDPRFLNMSFVSADERQRCSVLVTDAVVKINDSEDVCIVQIKEEPDAEEEVTHTQTSLLLSTEEMPQKRVKLENESSPTTALNADIQHTGLSRLLGDVVTNVEPVRPVQIRAQIEVTKYKSEDPCGLRDNPLSWWRCRQATYPLLSRLACHVLCMPATAIQSDRAFKSPDSTMDNRARIPHEHVDQMVFLQKNL
jgi:hypothetical protein